MGVFLSTPSARRATIEDAAGDVPGGISIHALCEEGDQGWHHDHHGQQISIHALCEEGDSPILGIQYSHARFLSTPSARRATGCNKQVVDLTYISIHALCEEGDYCFSNAAFVRSKFLSTPSARRATDPRVLLQRARTISIHALCEEGDPGLWHSDTKAGRISIHALCEEGDFLVKLCITVDAAFLSTPSARRATAPIRQSASLATNFYPRPLRGGRPLQMGTKADSLKISIHALCEEGDLTALFASLTGLISIHALCEEGDRQKP